MLWFIDPMEYCLVVKRKGILLFVTAWMDLQSLMVSERTWMDLDMFTAKASQKTTTTVGFTHMRSLAPSESEMEGKMKVLYFLKYKTTFEMKKSQPKIGAKRPKLHKNYLQILTAKSVFSVKWGVVIHSEYMPKPMF